MHQSNFIDAVLFAEEAYNVVAMAYNPMHRKVLIAADNLVSSLIHTNNLYDAERYAQFTVDALKDPMNAVNQLDGMVAAGYHNLANVITLQKGNLVKAELLVREAVSIRKEVQFSIQSIRAVVQAF
jgi:hypothetical protein